MLSITSSRRPFSAPAIVRQASGSPVDLTLSGAQASMCASTDDNVLPGTAVRGGELAGGADALDLVLVGCANPLKTLLDFVAVRWGREVWLRHFHDLPACASERPINSREPVLLREIRRRTGTIESHVYRRCLEVIVLASTNGPVILPLENLPRIAPQSCPGHPFLYAALAAADRYILFDDRLCDFATAIPAMKLALAARMDTKGFAIGRRHFAGLSSLPGCGPRCGRASTVQAAGLSLAPQADARNRAAARMKNPVSQEMFAASIKDVSLGVVEYFSSLLNAMATPSLFSTIKTTLPPGKPALTELLTATGVLTPAGWKCVRKQLANGFHNNVRLKEWVDQLTRIDLYQALPAHEKSFEVMYDYIGSKSVVQFSNFAYLQTDGKLTHAGSLKLRKRANALERTLEKLLPLLAAIVDQELAHYPGLSGAGDDVAPRDVALPAPGRNDDAASPGANNNASAQAPAMTHKLRSELQAKNKLMRRVIELARKLLDNQKDMPAGDHPALDAPGVSLAPQERFALSLDMDSGQGSAGSDSCQASSSQPQDSLMGGEPAAADDVASDSSRDVEMDDWLPIDIASVEIAATEQAQGNAAAQAHECGLDPWTRMNAELDAWAARGAADRATSGWSNPAPLGSPSSAWAVQDAFTTSFASASGANAVLGHEDLLDEPVSGFSWANAGQPGPGEEFRFDDSGLFM